jgi:hypothetical protein
MSLIGEEDAVFFSFLVIASLIVLKPPNLGLLVKNAIGLSLPLFGLEECLVGSSRDCSFVSNFVTIGLSISLGDSSCRWPRSGVVTERKEPKVLPTELSALKIPCAAP